MKEVYDGGTVLILFVLYQMDQAGEPKPMSFVDWLKWKSKLLTDETSKDKEGIHDEAQETNTTS
jgi:hypothetical protein